MGPIDFSKFHTIKEEYGRCFKFETLVTNINDLKTEFYPFIDYIDLLGDKDRLKNIVLSNNTNLLKWKKKFDKKLKFDKKKCSTLIITKNKDGSDHQENCTKCTNCNYNKKLTKFSDSLIEILGYNSNGRKSLRKIYSQLDLKTCYICNAQYALSINPEGEATTNVPVTKQNRAMSKFQFDHYLPKSLYPCFSISLYNLLPICSGCNSIKTDNDIGINFFDDTTFKDSFTFKILDGSLTSYLTNQTPLYIDFIDNYKYEIDTTKFSDRFDIKGIYNTQLDLIEELIQRKLKYTDAYKNVLTTSFPKIFTSNTVDERIMLGTYSKKEGIHKRPMSKFLQDINSQLDEYFQKEIIKKK